MSKDICSSDQPLHQSVGTQTLQAHQESQQQQGLPQQPFSSHVGNNINGNAQGQTQSPQQQLQQQLQQQVIALQQLLLEQQQLLAQLQPQVPLSSKPCNYPYVVAKSMSHPHSIRSNGVAIEEGNNDPNSSTDEEPSTKKMREGFHQKLTYEGKIYIYI